MTPTAQRVVRGAAAVSGRVLEGVFAAVARLRPADKPLHPRGRLFDASIERTGVTHRVGVPWIDEPGSSIGLVRLSRATGLPHPLPDIHGIALRLPVGDSGHADLLFATTGLGRLTRYLLVPALESTSRAYSTLLPYRTDAGAVSLAVVPEPDDTFRLACARVGGPWEEFARMSLVESPVEESRSFDPVLNQLPGLDHYPWAADLREGAYRAARRSRGDDGRV